MVRRQYQRVAGLAAMACMTALWMPVRADESPIVSSKAYVQKKIVLARSGPGLEYYPTDAVSQGDSVEILERRDEWLGIRPPDGSFSWIDGRHVQRAPGSDEARVTDDDVAVWVGSSVSAVTQHEHQIRLRRGEVVRIMEQKEIAAADGSTRVWLKIAPPAGELRWIESRDVSEQPVAPTPTPSAADANAQEHDTSSSETSTRSTSPSTDDSTHEPRAFPEWARRGAGRGNSANSSSARGPSGHRTASSASTDTQPATIGQELDRLLSSGHERSFEDQLATLQLALSRAAAKVASRKDLAKLQQRIELLVSEGESPYERGRASLLLESVRELIALAERRETQVEPASFDFNLDGMKPIGSGTRDTLSTLQPSSTATRNTEDELSSIDHEDEGRDSPYVARGWLMPVASRDKSAPPFVVMDRNGLPLAFVTPVPDLNLRRYVDKEVGVVGKPSASVFGHEHVIAERIVDLERQRNQAEKDEHPSRSLVPWIRFRSSN